MKEGLKISDSLYLTLLKEGITPRNYPVTTKHGAETPKEYKSNLISNRDQFINRYGSKESFQKRPNQFLISSKVGFPNGLFADSRSNIKNETEYEMRDADKNFKLTEQNEKRYMDYSSEVPRTNHEVQNRTYSTDKKIQESNGKVLIHRMNKSVSTQNIDEGKKSFSELGEKLPSEKPEIKIKLQKYPSSSSVGGEYVRKIALSRPSNLFLEQQIEDNSIGPKVQKLGSDYIISRMIAGQSKTTKHSISGSIDIFNKNNSKEGNLVPYSKGLIDTKREHLSIGVKGRKASLVKQLRSEKTTGEKIISRRQNTKSNPILLQSATYYSTKKSGDTTEKLDFSPTKSFENKVSIDRHGKILFSDEKKKDLSIEGNNILDRMESENYTKSFDKRDSKSAKLKIPTEESTLNSHSHKKINSQGQNEGIEIKTLFDNNTESALNREMSNLFRMRIRSKSKGSDLNFDRELKSLIITKEYLNSFRKDQEKSDFRNTADSTSKNNSLHERYTFDDSHLLRKSRTASAIKATDKKIDLSLSKDKSTEKLNNPGLNLEKTEFQFAQGANLNSLKISIKKYLKTHEEKAKTWADEKKSLEKRISQLESLVYELEMKN